LKYLQLVRFPNLIFIALTQYFIRFGIYPFFDPIYKLNNQEFFLLVFSTSCVAAAGYIINDIFDRKTDSINKPEKVLIGKKIPEKLGYRLYFILNIIGVAAGFFLANRIGIPGFAGIFIGISILLYWYASLLKGVFLAGNFLIALLVFSSLILVPVFDILPAVHFQSKEAQTSAFNLIFHYAVFAFSITLLREIVKDIADINGDKNAGLKTLPIILGRRRAAKIVFFLTVLLLTGIVWFMYDFLYDQKIRMLYFLIAIVGPLLYFCIKTFEARTRNDFLTLSGILKIIIFTGICSMLLFRFQV